MTDLKISQLPNAASLQDSDLFAVVQNDGAELVTAKTSVAALRGTVLKAPEQLSLNTASDGNGFSLDYYHPDGTRTLMPDIDIDFSLGNFAFDVANMNDDNKWGELNLNIVNDVPIGEIRYITLYSSTENNYSDLTALYINGEYLTDVGDYGSDDSQDKWRLSYVNKIDYCTADGKFSFYKNFIDYAYIFKFTNLGIVKFIEITQVENYQRVIATTEELEPIIIKTT